MPGTPFPDPPTNGSNRIYVIVFAGILLVLLFLLFAALPSFGAPINRDAAPLLVVSHRVPFLSLTPTDTVLRTSHTVHGS